MSNNNNTIVPKSGYQCPICDIDLSLYMGEATNPKNGITLICENMGCKWKEVMGHGKDEKGAFEIIKQKTSFRIDK